MFLEDWGWCGIRGGVEGRWECRWGGDIPRFVRLRFEKV